MPLKPQDKTFVLKVNWGKLGMSLSVLCAIHCLAMPFLITLLPLAGSAFNLSWTSEILLIGSSIALSSVSLGHDYYKHHHSFKPMLFLISAILFIVLVNVISLPTNMKWVESSGGILIFAAFLVNRKQMKNFHSCPVHQHSH